MAKQPSLQEEAFLVNEFGVLAIPGVLWVAFGLLARHWLLLLMEAVSSLQAPGGPHLLGGDQALPWVALLAQVPVLLLALSGAHRRPEAGAWARWVWRRGREIVTLAALLNLGWTAKILLASDYWTLWPELFLVCCSLLDWAIALSVYRTPLLAKRFSEFPQRAGKLDV